MRLWRGGIGVWGLELLGLPSLGFRDQGAAHSTDDLNPKP